MATVTDTQKAAFSRSHHPGGQAADPRAGAEGLWGWGSDRPLAAAGSRAIILSLGLDTASEREAGSEETSMDRGARGSLAGMVSYLAAQV